VSTRVTAHIHVGGDFPRSLLPQLYAVVHEEDLGSGDNYSGSGFDEKEFRTEEDVIEEINESGLLCLMTPEAPNGMLVALEAFLKARNIPYDRFGAASSGEFMSDVSYFRPGMANSRDLVTDDDGEPIIPASTAITAYEALLGGNVHAALTTLEPYHDYKVPPLPPFKIVDGVE
jgi:hypothetical protein